MTMKAVLVGVGIIALLFIANSFTKSGGKWRIIPSLSKPEKVKEGEKDSQSSLSWGYWKDQESGRSTLVGNIALLIATIMVFAPHLEWWIVRDHLWFPLFLVAFGSLGFWGVNLGADPKIRKKRSEATNNFLLGFFKLSLAISILLWIGLRFINPSIDLSQIFQSTEASTQTTETTKNGRIISDSDSKLVLELKVEPGKLSPAFEEIGGQSLLAALKRPGGVFRLEPLNKNVVECYDIHGKLLGSLRQTQGKDQTDLSIKASQVARVQFKSKNGNTVRLTVTH